MVRRNARYTFEHSAISFQISTEYSETQQNPLLTIGLS